MNNKHCATNIDISTFMQGASKPLSVFMRSAHTHFNVYRHISIYRKSF